MGYIANVRNTFNRQRFGRQATFVGLVFTFYVSFAISRESDPILAYILLLTSAFIAAIVHWQFSGLNVLRANDSLQLRRAFLPIGFGVLTLTAVLLLLLLTLRPTLRPEAAGAKLEIIVFLILAGIAEEFRFRFVDMQTFPYAPISANVFFSLLHPQVARFFSGQVPDLGFAIFAFFFGLAMTGAVALYEVRMVRNLNRGFGIIYATTVHVGYNIIVTIWILQVAGFEFVGF